MKPRSPVLATLAERYGQSAAGRHGGGRLDFRADYEALLAEAGCAEGAARELAERELQSAHEAGLIRLVPIHRRDPRHFSGVRLSPANEEAFFAALGQVSPTALRAQWAALFAEAEEWPVPPRFAEAWQSFCRNRAEAAFQWRGMAPFERHRLEAGHETLLLLSRLLAWENRHLVRWASSVLCGDSKALERRRKTLEPLLAEATAGAAPTLQSLGILPVPPGVHLHGPLRICIEGEWNDLGHLRGPATLSGADIARITDVECRAARCLTIENFTPFRSMAALGSGELLIQTSYPNEATLALLGQLARHVPGLEFWHFGDTDPAGFHILADLRARSGLLFRAFQMDYRPDPAAPVLRPGERALVENLLPLLPDERPALEAMLAHGNKGAFEQESLKPPPLARWPFY